VSRRPLFSTYSQGENRVTGSMIAVFERLDLSTLERILEVATEESSLQLVSFDIVRPEGPGTVPDARIAASFKYLFEVKTAYDALRRDQIEGHLKKLDRSHADERLFVVTPDPEEPAVITTISDERVRWMSFSTLNEAINEGLRSETVAGEERFLLRELQTLLSQEGLLGREDTVVVAARSAYGFYLRHSAYVCQSGRAFRRGLSRMGYYRSRKIESHIPTILYTRDAVPFTSDETARLRATGDDLDASIADLIEATVGSGEQVEGQSYQVFLLSSPESEQTCRLPQPISHEGPGSAWTMGQRYAHFDRLRAAPRTTAELA
jgi:hypothetical protein